MPRKFKGNSGRRTVQPFTEKDANDIMILLQKRRDAAKEDSEVFLYDRDWMMFKLGINTALRIEDLLQLKVEDVHKGYIYTREAKTNKEQSYELNDKLYNDITVYIKRNNLYPGEYLFRSRKGRNMPITRQNAWMRIKKYSDECNIKYLTGCHSLRKCFSRAYYEKTGDIIGLQEMLNHSSPRITLVYICVLDETKRRNRKGFYI